MIKTASSPTAQRLDFRFPVVDVLYTSRSSIVEGTRAAFNPLKLDLVTDYIFD